MLETNLWSCFKDRTNLSMSNNRALDPAMAGRLAYPIGKSDPIFSYLLQIGLFFFQNRNTIVQTTFGVKSA